MSIRCRVLLASGAVLVVVGMLAGCAGGRDSTESTKTAAPSATPSPVFTSDAEALAAATKVYAKFVALEDEIARDGGANPERIKPFVSDAGYEHEVDAARKFRQEHGHGVGETKINSAKLQSARQAGRVATVTIYVCQDLRGVDVQDTNGKSLNAPSRSDFVAFLSTLSGKSPSELVVQSNTYWSGGGVCTS